jgi:hypothetical protein
MLTGRKHAAILPDRCNEHRGADNGDVSGKPMSGSSSTNGSQTHGRLPMALELAQSTEMVAAKGPPVSDQQLARDSRCSWYNQKSKRAVVHPCAQSIL